MSLSVAPKRSSSTQGKPMVNGELVEKPRTVSTTGFKPIVKPGKPAQEPRQSIKDRMASMSMEPMETKSESWNTPVDIEAVRKEIKTPTTYLPELKETHKRQTYALPKYDPVPDKKEVIDLFDSLTVDKIPEVESEDDYNVDGLSVKLLPHQVAGVKFLRDGEKSNISGGFLCDDMGLGKTVQSIALILKNQPGKDHKGPGTTLVVSPLAVMDQWAEEISTKAPGLSVKTHHGTKRTTDLKDLMKFNVIVTTYDVVGSEYKRLQNKKAAPLLEGEWYRIIADESHTFRNKATQLAKAMAELKSDGRRWALSGTPINNSINDLFPQIRFIGIAPFSKKEYWAKTVKDEKGRQVLKKLLQSCLLRRSQKCITLPECRRTIHRFQVSENEAKLLSEVADKDREGDDDIMRLTQLLRSRQICDDPVIVEESLEGEESKPDSKSASKSGPKSASKSEPKSEPNIKDEPLTTESTSTPADKEPAIKQEENDLNSDGGDADDLAALLGDISISENKNGMSSKSKEILKILKQDPKRKTVVFSSFVSMLDRLAGYLRDEGIGYKIYHGQLSAPGRRLVLQKFRTDEDTSVLLCSLKCAAVGINITTASRVIMVEPWWNPMVVDQAVNRVHRIGQENPVDVYEMMAANSIEERMFVLQDSKRKNASHMLKEDKKLDDADVRFLLYGPN